MLIDYGYEKSSCDESDKMPETDADDNELTVE